MLVNSSLTNVESQLGRTVRLTIAVISLAFLGLLFNFHDPVLRGFFIGALVSLQNSISLNRRLQKVTAAKESRKAISLMRRGFYTRLAIIMLTLWLCTKVPNVSQTAAAIGIIYAPVASAGNFLVSAIKESASFKALRFKKDHQQEGGEKIC